MALSPSNSAAMPSCEYCTDLTALHHKVLLQDLRKGVAQGCRGCLLLDEAIHVALPEVAREAKQLAWVVERSMHITLSSDTRESDITVELYVELGELAQ